MNEYINYHSKPYSKFMSVSEYNTKYGTNLPEDKQYEMYFKLHYNEARKQAGPDEFVTVKFYDLKQKKSWSKWLEGKAGGKWREETVVKEAPKKVVEEHANLDDMLSDEEVEEVAEQVPEVSELDQIKEIVVEAAADASSVKQDLKHLIQFKSSSIELRDQLLKGRPRYLQAIKDYVKGNKDATIRMSYRKGKRSVKIASLNPKLESLKELLKSQPGEPRVVECL